MGATFAAAAGVGVVACTAGIDVGCVVGVDAGVAVADMVGVSTTVAVTVALVRVGVTICC